MVSPWKEAKGLVSSIVRETTEDNHHPPSFHWLGDHTQLSLGLKELDWMPHVNLVQELVQLTDVIAEANPNTKELMSCLASQLELFYTSTHAQLESLYYYCNTTLCRHMNEQLLLAVDKSYAQLVLVVIGCIRTTESLQIALGSLPDILQVAYMRDIPNPTIFTIEEHLKDDNDIHEFYMNDSSDDTDAEKSGFLSDRSASFQGNDINSSSNSSLQEARAGFLRLVMGEDTTNDPSESTANIQHRNLSGSHSTEEFLWSLGEHEGIEQNCQTQELNTVTSSAVTSLLANTPKLNQRSATNRQFGNANLRKHHQQQQQQQQQERLPHLELPRTIAQHPLLPHRLHNLFENPAPTLNIKRPWESPKNGNTDTNAKMNKVPDSTKNTTKSPRFTDEISVLDTLGSETSSDTSNIRIDGRKKRPRKNSYEETKDGPLRSAKRSRTSLEANASKMQKRFLSMVDQIVSSNFVDKLENASNDNNIKISPNIELSEAMSNTRVDTVVTINKDNLQSEYQTLNIAEGKTTTPEASPKNITGQILFNESIRPKVGFYKEIDEVHSTLDKNVNPNLDEKDSPSAKIVPKDKNKESNFRKTKRVTKQTLTEMKSKKTRGRPRKIKK